jgi:hypothetical protein
MTPRNGDEIVRVIKIIDDLIMRINKDIEKDMNSEEYRILFAQKEILYELKTAFLKARK